MIDPDLIKKDGHKDSGIHIFTEGIPEAKLDELLKNEIVLIVELPTLMKNDNEQGTFLSFRLNKKYTNLLENYVKERIDSILELKTKTPFSIIKGKAKAYAYDVNSELKYYKKELKERVKRLSNLDVYVKHYEMVLMFLPDYMLGKGLLEFIETGKIEEFRNYAVVEEAIEGLIDFKIIDKIKERITKLSEKDKKNVDENKHIRIFINKIAFALFEHLKESVEKEHADYSFIYAAMRKDGFIYSGVGDIEFRNWLEETYGVIVNKFKPYNSVSLKGRLSNYQTAKQLYKP